MTFAVYGLAALLAAAGTRLAVAVFAGTAVLAAVQHGSASPATAATAAMAAFLIGSGIPPRRVAIPAIGAAAVIAAGAAGNAAIVLALWTVGTAAAVESRPRGQQGGRWAFAVLQSDLLVAATVVYTALNYGFASWPQGLGNVGVGALIVAALIRVPAIGWPDERHELGLVLVRAQTIVLLTVAVRAASHELLIATAAAGPGLFAVAVLAERDAVRDAAQETGLLAAALATSALGWQPAGWAWGVIVGGTLMHQLRLSGRGHDRTSTLARAMERSGGIGLPLLPAVGAVMTAALHHLGSLRPIVLLALAAGLAGRSRSSTERVEAKPQVEPLTWWREVVVGASAAASLVAAALALPHPPGGDRLAWPPLWVVGVVVAAAAVAGLIPALAPRDEVARVGTVVSPPVLDRITRVVDPPGGTGTLVGLLCVLAVLGAGLLVVGWLRGFL